MPSMLRGGASVKHACNAALSFALFTGIVQSIAHDSISDCNKCRVSGTQREAFAPLCNRLCLTTFATMVIYEPQNKECLQHGTALVLQPLGGLERFA